MFFLCNLQNYRSQIEVFLSLVSDRFALEIIARLRQTSIVRDKGSFKLKISECGIFYLFNNCTIHGVLRNSQAEPFFVSWSPFKLRQISLPGLVFEWKFYYLLNTWLRPEIKMKLSCMKEVYVQVLLLTNRTYDLLSSLDLSRTCWLWHCWSRLQWWTTI